MITHTQTHTHLLSDIHRIFTIKSKLGIYKNNPKSHADDQFTAQDLAMNLHWFIYRTDSCTDINMDSSLPSADNQLYRYQYGLITTICRQSVVQISIWTHHYHLHYPWSGLLAQGLNGHICKNPANMVPTTVPARGQRSRNRIRKKQKQNKKEAEIE